MKTIKLIDFLTRIANGDNNLPKRIIFDYKVFELEDFLHYQHKGKDLMEEIKDYVNINVALNDKVEILESKGE
jgi:hypothetical protein